jgi:hypothetical protein
MPKKTNTPETISPQARERVLGDIGATDWIVRPGQRLESVRTFTPDGQKNYLAVAESMGFDPMFIPTPSNRNALAGTSVLRVDAIKTGSYFLESRGTKLALFEEIDGKFIPLGKSELDHAAHNLEQQMRLFDEGTVIESLQVYPLNTIRTCKNIFREVGLPVVDERPVAGKATDIR